MLLVCSGEDTYRSLEKARELEAAFRQKYDPSGAAIDRLPSGKEGVDALLQRLATASLFAPRRFFRVDGLLSSCSKEKLKSLLHSLERDVDATIVVSLEEGDLSPKLLRSFEDAPKFKQYRYDPLSPVAFLQWASAYASARGITDMEAVRMLTAHAAGDAWAFVNEFQKWLAGGHVVAAAEKEPTAFDVMDFFLQSASSRWSALRRFDNAPAIISTIVGQARSLVLVQSGHSEGLHPYVVQKLVRMRAPHASARYARLAAAFVWARTGQANNEESLDILG